LPATAATVTSLSRAGTGAFITQVPCACADTVHAPITAQVATMVFQDRSVMVPSLLVLSFVRRVG
jgi:hypothetical protein